jgi:hypothetical protein
MASTASPTLNAVELSTMPCEKEGNHQDKSGSGSASDRLESRSEPIQPEKTHNLSHVAETENLCPLSAKEFLSKLKSQVSTLLPMPSFTKSATKTVPTSFMP